MSESLPYSASELIARLSHTHPLDSAESLALLESALPAQLGIQGLAICTLEPQLRGLAAKPSELAQNLSLGAEADGLLRLCEDGLYLQSHCAPRGLFLRLEEGARRIGALFLMSANPEILFERIAEFRTVRQLAGLLLGRALGARAIESQAAARRATEPLADVGRLVMSVAHEIGGPLQAITALSEVLLRDPDAEGRREAAERILRSALRCRSLAQDILSLGRVSRAVQRPVAITEALMDALELDRFSDVGEISIEITDEGPIPPVLADARRLTQVLSNLLTNARHASLEAGRPGLVRVQVRAHPAAADRGPTVTIAVEDDGPGIPKALVDRLFEPFASHRKHREGTGLGLFVSRRLVQEMGGDIQAAAPQNGSGARFVITLPAANSPLPVAGRKGLESVVLPPSRILVIDDDREILETYEVLLSLSGHEVIGLDRASKALLRLDCESFDAIVCDARLPDLSGPALRAELVRKGHPAADRIIFATGDVLNEALKDELEDFKGPVLYKPFRAEDLERALADVIQGKSP